MRRQASARAASVRRMTRWAIISVAPSGTPTRLSARSDTTPSPPVGSSSDRLLSVSPMNSGFPSVAWRRRWMKPSVASPIACAATSARVSACVEAGDGDALEGVLRSQAGEQLGEIVGAEGLDVAQRAERQQLHVVKLCHDVAQEQRRRGVGPVQVVEDQHDRAIRRDEGQHARHRVEQAIAPQRRARAAPARAASGTVRCRPGIKRPSSPSSRSSCSASAALSVVREVVLDGGR